MSNVVYHHSNIFMNRYTGWFLLLSSIIGYWRVKHWETSIRASSNRGPVTAEDIDRDIAIRRNIEQVFGIGFGVEDEGESSRRNESRSGRDTLHSNPVDQQSLQEARLARDLRAAGLL